MGLQDDLKLFVTEQFLIENRVKEEVETIHPFLHEMNIPITKENVEIFTTHLRDSLVSTLVLYAEENKITEDRIKECHDELLEMVLKAMDTAKLTFGYLVQGIRKKFKNDI